jgi:hypothetical protein
MMFSNMFMFRRLALLSALALGLIAAPHVSQAQQASIVGSPSNFDAANNEGQDANGFEIQIEGIQPTDLGPSWPGNKYGAPEVVPYATGVYVRYKSAWDSFMQLFTSTTVPKTPGVPFAGTCYQWNTAYLNAGCDHFGVHPLYTATGYTIVGYRWLFADPANPGQLIPSPNNIFVPTPVYSWVPPAVVGAPPVLVAEIQTPPPPPPPPAALPQFGDATWMKVYKNEITREVALEELTSDNPLVPQDITQIENDWVLMQPAPPPDGNHRQRNRQINQGGVNSGTRSVIRRYETYAYTGAYDPATHEVMCADGGLCNSPQPGELGDMINAQMAAANVAVPGVSVTIAGTGKVESADKVISCGSKCSSANSLGAVVTLTATPASNNIFSGWTGACTGTATTCAITVSDAMATTATFAPSPATGGGGGGSTTQFTLSVGLSNPGAVSATPAGIDRVLDCGSACSAKFNQGTVVTLTAIPPAGKTFANWSGACSGADPTCTLTISSDTSVKANFNK